MHVCRIGANPALDYSSFLGSFMTDPLSLLPKCYTVYFAFFDNKIIKMNNADTVRAISWTPSLLSWCHSDPWASVPFSSLRWRLHFCHIAFPVTLWMTWFSIALAQGWLWPCVFWLTFEERGSTFCLLSHCSADLLPGVPAFWSFGEVPTAPEHSRGIWVGRFILPLLIQYLVCEYSQGFSLRGGGLSMMQWINWKHFKRTDILHVMPLQQVIIGKAGEIRIIANLTH